MKTTLLLFLLTTSILGQELSTIIVGSKYNKLQINIVNPSNHSIYDIQVKVVNPPEWVEFDKIQKFVPQIESKNSVSIEFEFNLLQEAPLEENFITVKCVSSSDSWMKVFKILPVMPMNYELFQNYPNPFNPVTTIDYQIPENGFVILTIYDILGREVSTLVKAEKKPGKYSVSFDASKIASGTYIYRLKTNDYVEAKKMIVLK